MAGRLSLQGPVKCECEILPDVSQSDVPDKWLHRNDSAAAAGAYINLSNNDVRRLRRSGGGTRLPSPALALALLLPPPVVQTPPSSASF